MPAEEHRGDFDPARVIAVLESHRVEYLLVGGLAAEAHGAHRQTYDFDCVPKDDDENLRRLADALIELGARLHVAGMSDEEARALPVKLGARTLRAFGSSTWMTDAGPVDVLGELVVRAGRHRATYDELAQRGVLHEIGGVAVRLASLRDIVASKQLADRPKDREALPELLSLLERERKP